MKAKGKAPKVLTRTRKSASRLLTLPRGDAPQGARHKARKGNDWSGYGVCVGQGRQALDAVQ